MLLRTRFQIMAIIISVVCQTDSRTYVSSTEWHGQSNYHNNNNIGGVVIATLKLYRIIET